MSVLNGPEVLKEDKGPVDCQGLKELMVCQRVRNLWVVNEYVVYGLLWEKWPVVC